MRHTFSSALRVLASEYFFLDPHTLVRAPHDCQRCFDRTVDVIDRLSVAIVSLSHLIGRGAYCVWQSEGSAANQYRSILSII